jgi:hypothetical protein
MDIDGKLKGELLMSKKKLGIGIAAVEQQLSQLKIIIRQKFRRRRLRLNMLSTAIRSAESMRRTVRESIIQMVTTRHLPDRESRRAWMTRTHI